MEVGRERLQHKEVGPAQRASDEIHLILLPIKSIHHIELYYFCHLLPWSKLVCLRVELSEHLGER